MMPKVITAEFLRKGLSGRIRCVAVAPGYRGRNGKGHEPGGPGQDPWRGAHRQTHRARDLARHRRLIEREWPPWWASCTATRPWPVLHPRRTAPGLKGLTPQNATGPGRPFYPGWRSGQTKPWHLKFPSIFVERLVLSAGCTGKKTLIGSTADDFPRGNSPLFLPGKNHLRPLHKAGPWFAFLFQMIFSAWQAV